MFQEIGVDIFDRDIQACHRLKDKGRVIVKFTNRKDCLRILRAKRQLKGLDAVGTKILSMRVCALTIGGYETNAKN